MGNGQIKISAETFGKQCVSTKPIIVVSGLPRSGTSMLMQMLEAGGVPVYCDTLRQPDLDNPHGYYELARIKKLAQQQDQTWLGMAQGRVIKIISHFLPHLPLDYKYKTVLLNRDLNEVLASQNKMLARRGQPTAPNLTLKLRELFAEHLRQIRSWLDRQANFEVLPLEYSQILADPAGHAQQLQNFLDTEMQVSRMASVPDVKLYRNR